MKVAASLLLVCLLFPPQTARCGEGKITALQLPLEAIELLVEAGSETCSICVEEKENEAFEILDRELIPGAFFKTGENCRLVRGELCPENAFQLNCSGEPVPLLFLRFHTLERHLVGISNEDYTDKGYFTAHSSARVGDAFEGELILIPFKYGDGATYTYYRSTKRLEVHCKILSLKEVGREAVQPKNP